MLTLRCARRGAELPVKAFLISTGAAATLGACACIMHIAMACDSVKGQARCFTQSDCGGNLLGGPAQAQSIIFQAATSYRRGGRNGYLASNSAVDNTEHICAMPGVLQDAAAVYRAVLAGSERLSGGVQRARCS